MSLISCFSMCFHHVLVVHMKVVHSFNLGQKRKKAGQQSCRSMRWDLLLLDACRNSKTKTEIGKAVVLEQCRYFLHRYSVWCVIDVMQVSPFLCICESGRWRGPYWQSQNKHTWLCRLQYQFGAHYFVICEPGWWAEILVTMPVSNLLRSTLCSYIGGAETEDHFRLVHEAYCMYGFTSHWDFVLNQNKLCLNLCNENFEVFEYCCHPIEV